MPLPLPAEICRPVCVACKWLLSKIVACIPVSSLLNTTDLPGLDRNSSVILMRDLCIALSGKIYPELPPHVNGRTSNRLVPAARLTMIVVFALMVIFSRSAWEMSEDRMKCRPAPESKSAGCLLTVCTAAKRDGASRDKSITEEAVS